MNDRGEWCILLIYIGYQTFQYRLKQYSWQWKYDVHCQQLSYVNYSTFIILMIIIKTPGMFFVQCFTATSVTDFRWRSLIALALNCLLGGIANHSSRICALILLLRIDLPKFHHRVVHLAHDFMCKELRPMISSSLYILIDIHWETFGAQIIVSLFHKNTLRYFFCLFL